MRGVFDEEEREPAQGRNDRELTLGWGTLLAVFFGLVIVCSVCFGLGYLVGHREVKTAAAVDTTTPADREPLQPSGAVPKPSAIAQDVVEHPAAAGAEAEAPSGTAPAITVQDSTPGASAAAQAAAPQIRPALPSGGNAAEPQQLASQVRPALAPPAATFVVQVAAVANRDDAEVLLSALGKRNYAVTARQDAADHLIHVRVGPFATLAEAEQWKMKLLNDGYNAVVQP